MLAPCACAASSNMNKPFDSHIFLILFHSGDIIPPICTIITPTVSSIIFFSISLGSIDRLSRDTSANITLAPACNAARGVAMNVFVGIIIDLPSTLSALNGISNALVPLLTATAYFTPTNSAKSLSN